MSITVIPTLPTVGPAFVPATPDPAHAKVNLATTAAPEAATTYPCPYCHHGVAGYRYDIGEGARFFRCGSCGIEMPEGTLTRAA